MQRKNLFRKIKNKWNEICYSRVVKDIFSQYDDSYFFAYLPQGWGDILFFCMYVNAFRRTLPPNTHIALIISKPQLFSLAELYQSSYDDIIVLDGMLFKSWHTNRISYFYPKIYENSDYSETLLDAVRKAMDVQPEEEPNLPTIAFSDSECSKVTELVSNYKKIVLISPDANSCSKVISELEWISFADILTLKGYYVYFNCPPEQKGRFYPYQCIFPSLKELILLGNKIDLFVGYRSGLCDIIGAFCKCKQIVLYPNNRIQGEFSCIEDYDTNPNEKYMQFCSIKRMFPHCDINEYIISENILRQIGEHISG